MQSPQPTVRRLDAVNASAFNRDHCFASGDNQEEFWFLMLYLKMIHGKDESLSPILVAVHNENY